jgi:GT2 family glycosyltransferase
MVKLTILILNYKTRGLLKQFLKGLKMYSPKVEHEVIVVDNASNDGSVELIMNNHPEVKLIQNEQNVGYAKGNNIGIKSAKGEYILLINTDVVITDKEAIEKLVAFMDANLDVGIVGPLLKNPDGSVQESAYRFYKLLTPLYRRTFLGKTKYGQKELSYSQMKDWDRASSRDVDWLMSSCILLRKKALDDTGLLDERFFLYVSEEDLARRMWKTGWRVHFFADVNLIHYHRKQSADDFRVAIIHIKDFLKYLWKWRGK